MQSIQIMIVVYDRDTMIIHLSIHHRMYQPYVSNYMDWMDSWIRMLLIQSMLWHKSIVSDIVLLIRVASE
jgi:hypothetical protein